MAMAPEQKDIHDQELVLSQARQEGGHIEDIQVEDLEGLAELHERMMLASAPTKKPHLIKGVDGKEIEILGVFNEGLEKIEMSRYVDLEKYHAGEEYHPYYVEARTFLIQRWLSVQINNLRAAGVENPIVLEIGAGTGLFSSAIAEAFPQCTYIAAEIDEAAYKFMMRRKESGFKILDGVVPVEQLPSNVHPIHADGVNLSLPQTGAHIIVMPHAFHHYMHMVKDLGMEVNRGIMEVAARVTPGCNPAMYIIDECHSGDGNLPRTMQEVPKRIEALHGPYISDMITKKGILGREVIDDDVKKTLEELGVIVTANADLELAKKIAYARISGLLDSEMASQTEGQRVIREIIRLIEFVEGKLPEKYYKPWEIRELAAIARCRNFIFGPMGEAKISRQELTELIRRHKMRRSQSRVFVDGLPDNDTNSAGIHALEIRLLCPETT